MRQGRVPSVITVFGGTLIVTNHEGIRPLYLPVNGTAVGTPFFSGDQFHLIDAVYGPVFKYSEVFDQITKLAIFEGLPRIKIWHIALQQRSSIQLAVVPEYSELLLKFLKKRNSYI